MLFGTCSYSMICGFTSFFLPPFMVIIEYNQSKNGGTMRKTPQKVRPLQECIEAFHRSPAYECRVQLKGDENRLKKIGRNRLIFKEPSLPAINFPNNKENHAPSHHLQPISKEQKVEIQRSNTKNLSFAKSRPMNMEQKLSRMIQSQRDINQKGADEIKEAVLKKQFFIRDRKMQPQRNCMSANLKREDSKTVLPKGVKEIRKVIRARKSQEEKESKETRELAIYELAQRIAEDARPETAPNASKHPVRSASLEDFLNEWKAKRE